MKNKIRMPFGAAFACILVTVLVIVTAFAGCRLIEGSYGSSNSPEPTASPGYTESPTAEPTTHSGSSLSQPTTNTGYNGENATDEERYAMIEHCMDSVVSIDSSIEYNGEFVVASSGSGVIISADGYILTCNHVITDAENLTVYLNDGTEYTAEVIGVDSIKDLAVIKIQGNGFVHATFGVSSTLRIGEQVFAIGNALGELSNTYTTGSISGIDRNINVEGTPMTLLQTDAAINQGNSGGGLFRASDGTLIGIVNAKSNGSGIEGLGFAIPTDIAYQIASDLIEYGYVTGRPYLGVTTTDTVLYGSGFIYAPRYTYPKVTAVDENSPAAIAGIKVNDIIVAINGETISGGEELYIVVNSCNDGDTITITVLRNNRELELTVTLSVKNSN